MSDRKKIIVDELDAKRNLRSETPGSDIWSRSAKLAKKFRRLLLPPVPEGALFQEHNVIGSTGPEDTATVYYRSGDTFARVTTHYPEDVSNVGRSHARTFPDYRIANTGQDGTAEEFFGGEVQHESRHPFEPVTSTAEQTRLHTTASRFSFLKPKYRADK